MVESVFFTEKEPSLADFFIYKLLPRQQFDSSELVFLKQQKFVPGTKEYGEIEELHNLYSNKETKPEGIMG